MCQRRVISKDDIKILVTLIYNLYYRRGKVSMQHETFFFIQNKKLTITSYIQHYLQTKHYYTTKTIPRGAIS